MFEGICHLLQSLLVIEDGAPYTSCDVGAALKALLVVGFTAFELGIEIIITL